MIEYRIKQMGSTVAAVRGSSHEEAEAAILHYAMQYRADGPLKIERQEPSPTRPGVMNWKRHMFFEQFPPKEPIV
jgi:hypothetical protein